MHGIIFTELKRFVDEGHGPGVWDKLLTESGIGAKVYVALEVYPDEEIAKLAATAAKLLGVAVPQIFESFGEFMVPMFVKRYRHLLKPDWRTLDVIQHTEGTIHKVIRITNPGAKPPQLQCTRVSPKEVLLTYNSARRMCGIAKGICKGLARQFSEEIKIAESTCMLQRASECRITISLVR
jgi:hypothetical protein